MVKLRESQSLTSSQFLIGGAYPLCGTRRGSSDRIFRSSDTIFCRMVLEFAVYAVRENKEIRTIPTHLYPAIRNERN